MNKKYYLKSIISLYQSNNGFKYFSDVCINGNWYRFCDNNDFNINIKNIIQTGQGLNLNTDRPQQNFKY